MLELLALWTDMRTTACNTRLYDGCAAAGAGLAFSSEDISKLQVTALLAFGVDIISV